MGQGIFQRTVRPALGLCWCALLLTGCGRSLDVRVEGPSGPIGPLSGEVAVLKVTREEGRAALATTVGWGSYQGQNAQKHLAELISHAARETGWAQVLEPAEVEQRLKAKGLEPTLEPAPEQLPAFIEAVGCPSYLAAHILKWRTSFLLTRQRTNVEFSLSCFQPPFSTPVWEAHVKAEGSQMTDRETALLALKETYRRLTQGTPKGPAPPDG